MTRTVSKGTALAAAILIGTLALPTTADAGRYRGHHGGSALAAGIIGLAIGAAIGGAIAHDHHYGGYYEDHYSYGARARGLSSGPMDARVVCLLPLQVPLVRSQDGNVSALSRAAAPLLLRLRRSRAAISANGHAPRDYVQVRARSLQPSQIIWPATQRMMARPK